MDIEIVFSRKVYFKKQNLVALSCFLGIYDNVVLVEIDINGGYFFRVDCKTAVTRQLEDIKV